MKRLCCQNNFVIDFAKTLYKPEFPKEINEKISIYTNAKLPAFFYMPRIKTSPRSRKEIVASSTKSMTASPTGRSIPGTWIWKTSTIGR